MQTDVGFQKVIVKTLQRIGYRCLGFAKRMAPPSTQEMRVRPWQSINGDATLRVQYNLDSAALVLDVGGHEGDWAVEIAGRYGCTVHVFEPVPEFAARIKSRLGRNQKVHVHTFGLAGSTRNERMNVDAERSSIFLAEERGRLIQLVDIVEFCDTHQISKIDLLKINIEGGEYELLERLIETGHIVNITDVQVQFHDFVVNAERRMNALQSSLQETHFLTYQFPFVWENWRRKMA